MSMKIINDVIRKAFSNILFCIPRCQNFKQSDLFHIFPKRRCFEEISSERETLKAPGSEFLFSGKETPQAVKLCQKADISDGQNCIH